jgi:tripartite-type tricarboxylate transporter receptor subunit TctC
VKIFQSLQSAFGAMLASLVIGAAPALAQSYPTKQITLVAPFPAGGTTDTVARPLAEKLRESMGQTVIVDNRPGSGGVIGTAAVAKAPADGHTALIVFDTHATNPHMYKRLTFDTFKELTGVSQIVSIPVVLAAHPSVPANNVKELVQLAKSKPGAISYASVGAGSSNHLAAKLFEKTTGVELTHVPYKGGNPAVTDLLGGHVQLMFVSQSLVLAHVQSGKLKVLGVTTEKRSTVLPQVPTIAEQGYPGFNVASWVGVVVRSDTPKPIIERLHAEIAKAAKSADFQKRMSEAGFNLVASTPDEFNRHIKSESDRWGKIIKEENITAD